MPHPDSQRRLSDNPPGGKSDTYELTALRARTAELERQLQECQHRLQELEAMQLRREWCDRAPETVISPYYSTLSALPDRYQTLEQQVQERTAQLQLIMSVIQMGTWVWDIPTNREYWSPEEYQLLGFCTDTQGRVLDSDGNEIGPYPTLELFLQCVHPDDQARLRQRKQQALAEQSLYEMEYRLVHQDGSIHWIYSRGAYVFDEQGQPIKVVGVDMDISERKQLELELQLSQSKLSNILNGAIASISSFRVFADHRIQYEYCSLGCEAIFGYTPDEIIQNGQLWVSRVFPQDWHEVFIPRFNQIFSERTDRFEYRFFHKDGTLRWLSKTFSSQRDQATQSWLVTTVDVDITDRKLAETTLRQQARQEQLLRRLTQEIHHSLDLSAILTTAVTEVRYTLQTDRVAVYHFNPDGSGCFIAESVADAWSSLQGHELGSVWEASYLQDTRQGCYRHAEAFTVTDVDMVGYHACSLDLLNRWHVKAYAVVPIFLGDDLWGLLVLHHNANPRDWQFWEVELLQQIATQLAIAIQQSNLYQQLHTELEERRAIEDQLRTSLTEQEVLLREIHHRVKNNMQLVSSLLHLQTRNITDPGILTLFNDSQQRVSTMALIHERLYQSPNLARINFADYIQDLTRDIFQSYRISKAIQLILDIAPVELSIDTAIPCGLILNELISNALKYAFPGDRAGEIVIRFQTEDGRCTLVVQDNGVGISPSITFQTTPTLGLQLVSGLAEQLGGTITLDQTEGSKFTVIFDV